jgi:hypothetical protein
VGELLRPRQRESDIEVFDDSEEEERLADRRARGLGVVSYQPPCRSFAFFCGVLLAISFFFYLCKGIANGRQRLEE